MTVDVSVDGHPWKVAIEPAERPGQFAVTVKGKRRVIDASWIDADTLSLLDGALVHEIRLDRRENGAVGVEIGGRVYEAVASRRDGRGFPDAFVGKPLATACEKGSRSCFHQGRRCRAGSCVSLWRWAIA